MDRRLFLVRLSAAGAASAVAAARLGTGQGAPEESSFAYTPAAATKVAPADASYILTTPANGLPNAKVLGTDIIRSGVLASRPAPTAVPAGVLYLATDDSGGTFYRSDGSAWTKTGASASIGPPIAGVVAGPSSPAWRHGVAGEANPRFEIVGDGTVSWGTGAGPTDTRLSRIGSGLEATGSFSLREDAVATNGPDLFYKARNGQFASGIDVAAVVPGRDFVVALKSGGTAGGAVVDGDNTVAPTWFSSATAAFSAAHTGRNIEAIKDHAVVGNITNGSRIITGLSTNDFTASEDMGRCVSGDGIPPGAYVIAVPSASSVEISDPATATADGASLTIVSRKVYPANTTMTFVSSTTVTTSAPRRFAATGLTAFIAPFLGQSVNDIIYVSHNGPEPASVGVGLLQSQSQQPFRFHVSPDPTKPEQGGVNVRTVGGNVGDLFAVTTGDNVPYWRIKYNMTTEVRAWQGGEILFKLDTVQRRLWAPVTTMTVGSGALEVPATGSQFEIRSLSPGNAALSVLASAGGNFRIRVLGVSPYTVEVGTENGAPVEFQTNGVSRLRLEQATSKLSLLDATSPFTLALGSLNGSMVGGAGEKVGFLGASPIARPTVSGSRAGNEALADLLVKLAALGLLTDSTSI